MAFDFDTESAKLSPALAEKQPTSNVEAAIFDAERVFSIVNQRHDKLATVPTFDIASLDNIPPIAGILRSTDLDCEKALRLMLTSANKDARDESDTIIGSVKEAARFLFRKDPETLKDIEAIGDTGALHDRAADLHRAAVFCEAHPELAASDSRVPANTPARARELASMLAAVADNSASKATFRKRNLAFWMLHDAVNEVRAAVRFACPDDKEFVTRVCTRYEPPKKKKAKDEPEPK
ncbi:MAG TPA: hypothetical protein DFS52_29080 [Myxococcales bacterium]|nr:hypothetical protein [Myxococcales bacterium]